MLPIRAARWRDTGVPAVNCQTRSLPWSRCLRVVSRPHLKDWNDVVGDTPATVRQSGVDDITRDCRDPVSRSLRRIIMLHPAYSSLPIFHN